MRSRTRLVVLGLDGLSLSLARRLCDLTDLPALASLAHDPKATSLASELPELSPVNWTSFFTASGPGEHGVYGFTRLDPASYELSVTDSSHVRVPTIFERLGEQGLASKVLNLPNTYPARPLRGMLVAGFVAPELSRATHPPVLASMLARQGYVLEAETSRGRSEPGLLLDGLCRSLASRRAALDLLWQGLDFDLFVYVLTETDRLFHFLLDAVLDPAHGLHGRCMELLRLWDGAVAHALQRYAALPEPKRLVVLADHGFAPLITEVDVNAWLRERGFLALLPARQERQGAQWEAARIAPETRAFALDPGRIYLHDRQRFDRGRLSRHEGLELRQAIRQGLLELRFDGQPVMEAVHPGQELYQGLQAHAAPDLVCLARPGFDLKAKFDRKEVFGLFGRTGTHTAHDAFFLDSRADPDCCPVRLRDTGRLVLSHFGLRA